MSTRRHHLASSADQLQASKHSRVLESKECEERSPNALVSKLADALQKELADGPAAIANGGTIIADAYSS